MNAVIRLVIGEILMNSGVSKVFALVRFVLLLMFVCVAGCQTFRAIGSNDSVVVNVANDGEISYYVKSRNLQGSVKSRSMKLYLFSI